MYATPAAGSGPNAEELESYLLGKKRVDKLLRDNEDKVSEALRAMKKPILMHNQPEQLSAQSSGNAPDASFTALQNANSARDTANKVREDPLLAIKRQEQAAYERLMKNPAKLRAMRDGQASLSAPSDSKDERRARKEARREERERRRDERHRHKHSRHRYDYSDDDDDEARKRSRHRDDRDHRARSRSPLRHHNDRVRDSPRRDSYSPRRRSDSRSPPPRASRHDDGPREHERRRSPPPPRRRHIDDERDSRVPHAAPRDDHRSAGGQGSRPRREEPPREAAPAKDDAAARLAAMQASATRLQQMRSQRLTQLDAQDRLEAEKDAANRKANGSGMNGIAPAFLREQERQVFSGGMDLGERLRRSGKIGMSRERD